MSHKTIYKLLSAIALVCWPLSDIHKGDEPRTVDEYKGAIRNILLYLIEDFT